MTKVCSDRKSNNTFARIHGMFHDDVTHVGTAYFDLSHIFMRHSDVYTTLKYYGTV